MTSRTAGHSLSLNPHHNFKHTDGHTADNPTHRKTFVLSSSSSCPLSFPRSLLLSLFFLLLFFLPSPLLALDSLSYKIGQMVMSGFIPDSDFEDTLYYDLANRNLGGVILMAYNLDSPAQIADLTDTLRRSSTTPPFIATDQEGGLVARLDEQNGYSETYRALKLGNTNKESFTRSQASLMAGWLSDAGINTNLAPVADVNVNPSSPAIGVYERSFSADPGIVFKHVYWFYSEFHEREVISALKHFPGHGSAVGDSHAGFTDISNTWSESELIPFAAMIDTGYNDMIMTGHLYNANIDTNYPATLSKPTLTGILRDSLGYNGVIISDDMGMGAISNNYSFIESVTQTIDAGIDILLYVWNEKYGRSVLDQIIRVVKTAVDSGLVTEQRIDESYERIMALKKRMNTGIVSYPPLIAETFDLKAYPNPFNPATCISFTLSENIYDIALLRIYDLNGKLVSEDQFMLNGPGRYELYWDAGDIRGKEAASGTYIYSITYGKNLLSGKMTLIK